MKEEERKGFSYHVSEEKIRVYQSWPVEKRLAWLYEANRLRNRLPLETIRIQDAFRKGER